MKRGGNSKTEPKQKIRKSVARRDRRLVSMADWQGVGVTRKRSTNKNKQNKKHHTSSANIPGSPRQPEISVGGHRHHVLKFYLVGQSANPTGWPAQDNWRLGTYIHQRPLPWRWRLRALPHPSCLCPSARGRGTGTKTDIWESVTNFCTMGKRLVRRHVKDHHPWHYIRTTNKNNSASAKIKFLLIFLKENSCIQKNRNEKHSFFQDRADVSDLKDWNKY